MAKPGKSRIKDITGLFTEKELQVIRLICAQHSNEEMAVKLERSLRTVEGYRAGILEKTKARNTAGIVIYAIRWGIYKIRK